MRCPLATVILGAALGTAQLSAQTVRGTIVDETRRLPVGEALVTLLGANDAEIRNVRSDSLGRFVIQAGAQGTYRVRATRIGYRPLTSDAVSLGPATLAVLQLRMTTLAQQLVPIRVVERRKLTLTELMSVSGFDLRRSTSKGIGKFLDAEQLAGYNLLSAGEVLRQYLFPNVMIGDVGDGPFLWMNKRYRRAGSTERRCFPVIYLDGSQLRGRESAFSLLEGYSAGDLYGIEVYREGEVPPPSLGGELADSCVVAVWTKNGINRRGNAPKGPGLSGIQVLRGTTVDFDSGKPLANVPVRLLNEANEELLSPIKSDSVGEFTIRTNRIGPLRLEIGDIGNDSHPTPVFRLEPEELVIVKLFASAKTPVMAPLGIQRRLLPSSFAVTDLATFAYRRERGIAGTFFGPDDVRRAGSIAGLLHGVDGVVASDTIFMRSTLVASRAPCRPATFLNGAYQSTGFEDAVKTFPLNSLFGIEVYTRPSDVPHVHADVAPGCGMIGIWTR